MNALVEKEISQISHRSFEIASTDDIVRINAVLKGVKMLKKKVEEELNPRVEEAFRAHRGLIDLKNKYLDPLKIVEAKINVALKAWTLRQESEAKALQDKINKELAERAEALRLGKLKEAEGADEWTQEIAKEEAQAMVPATVDLKDCKEAVAPKQEGQYKRSNWKARVVDITKLDRMYLMPNMELLNQAAKAQKENFNVKGAEAYDDFTIVTKV